MHYMQRGKNERCHVVMNCAVAVDTAVGVTNDINEDQLGQFASNAQYAMKIQDFSDLPTVLEITIYALRQLCPSGN